MQHLPLFADLQASRRPRRRRRRRGRAARDAAARGGRRRDGHRAELTERLAELAADGPIHPRAARLCGRLARALLARHRGDRRPRRQRGRRGRGRSGQALLQRRRRPGALHVHHAGHRRPLAGHDRDRQQRPVARARALDQGRHRDAAAGAARRPRRARGPLAAARARAGRRRDRAAPFLGARRHGRRRGARVRGPRRRRRARARERARRAGAATTSRGAARRISSARAPAASI